MKKKLLALVLCVALVATMCIGLAACSKSSDNKYGDITIGFIMLHDSNSTYDKNFIDAATAVQNELGLSASQVIIKTNIPEGQECYEAAADLVDQGCDIVFADSFGHEDYMIQAAKEFPNVQFCHATGTKAHTENLANFHNAFASIYEGRYLAGIAAGMKLKALYGDDITAAEAKIGYVGAYTYAEVISGLTSFYLGAKSVVSNATMEVKFTGSWYNQTAEGEAANALITNGCKLISQHADSMGAPNACETAGIPNVSYNGSTASACPNTFIVSSKINWAPYYKYIINSVANNTAIAADWCGGIAEGSVELTALGSAAADGTQAAIDAAKAKFANGSLKVFDTSTFTVSTRAFGTNGSDDFGLNTKATVDATGKLTNYSADVNTDAAYAGDTEVVKNGYFSESEYRSAPYFDIQIDGITFLNAMY